MLRYDISKLAARRKGTVQPLPAIHGSVGAEAAYLKALRAMLRELARDTRERLLPEVEREIAAKRLTRDAFSEFTFGQFVQMSVRLSVIAEQMVTRILGLEARRHTTNFMASAKRVLGVDLSAVLRQEDLADYLANAALRNAGLIKGLADDVVKRVQHTITTALINGTPMKDLRKDLTEQFGVSDRRAKLLARDQVGKLTSDLNRIRQQQAGIEKYIYRTSHDERVRPLHRSFDGNTYTWDDPPSDGPPGTAVNCRCIGQAVVEF